MTVLSALTIKSHVRWGKRVVSLGPTDELYEVENILPAGIIEDNEINPAGWWRDLRSFFNAKEDKEDVETVTAINEKEIRKYLGHLYVKHFLLGDKTATPANLDVLNNQAWKLGVADIPYSFPDYDCEDRSFACMGAWHLNAETAKMATYIAWVSYAGEEGMKAHALNAACVSGKFFFYEPAQYKFFEIPDFWMLNVLMG